MTVTTAERLARAYMRVRHAHNPDGDELDALYQEVKPCAWCRLAAEQHIQAAALSGEAAVPLDERRLASALIRMSVDGGMDNIPPHRWDLYAGTIAKDIIRYYAADTPSSDTPERPA